MLHKDFPVGSDSKVSVYNVVDAGLIPGSGRSSEEGKGYPLQYSSLENSMDHTVHGVAKSGAFKWVYLSFSPLSEAETPTLWPPDVKN